MSTPYTEEGFFNLLWHRVKYLSKVLTGLFIDTLFLALWYLIHHLYKKLGDYLGTSVNNPLDSFYMCYTAVQWLLDIAILLAILKFVVDDVRKLWKQV